MGSRQLSAISHQRPISLGIAASRKQSDKQAES